MLSSAAFVYKSFSLAWRAYKSCTFRFQYASAIGFLSVPLFPPADASVGQQLIHPLNTPVLFRERRLGAGATPQA